jgi:hypothetical protein
MSDDYLWNRSGDGDAASAAEIARLEALLARHRFDPAANPPTFLRTRPPRRRALLIALAALAAAVVALIVWLSVPKGPSYLVHGVEGRSSVRAGDELETRAGETARVEIAHLGEVEVAGESRLRVEDCGTSVHSLFLERGSLEARIYAQPRVFQIGTPSGRTVDLGCRYELEVDDDGRASLRVTQGQVELVFGGREVYVPMHAHVDSTPERGPGWPMFEAPSQALLDVLALARGELATKTPEAVLEQTLRECTDEDTLTLWHMYDGRDLPDWVRERIYEALSREFPLPADVDRAAIERGDRDALRSWRESMTPKWRSS